MPQISGENSVPLGVAGTGSAYVLGSHEPNALAIIQQGGRARALVRERQRAAQLKKDQENAKQFNDAVKFDQDGSPYFAEVLNNEVYKPLVGELAQKYKDNKNDSFAARLAAAPILQRADNETKQSKAKSQYLDSQLKSFQADKELYDSAYAGQVLSAARRREDGTNRLPSEFDAEAWHDNLLGDHQLYREPAVVKRATDKLMPIITQKVADAGALGGQHTADQVRGRFVAFDGKGHAILNADGSPKLNLTADTQALLESDPLFKLKVDAREAAYNQKREADPSMPQMSRRGHIAQMVGPLAFYDESRDEALNAQPRQPRTTKADPNAILATPTVTGQTSYYRADGSGTNTPNHYAAVGHSFGSASKPYVEVEANNGAMQIVGQNGEVTRPNTAQANGRVPMRLMSRDYVLYANGKRLGRPEPFQNDEEAHQHLLKLIRESPHPEKLELRVMGHGVVVDKAKTAGDGLGGGPQATGFNRKTGKPTYDTSTTETEHSVLVPMTQDMDAQLKRATNGKWNPYQASAQEKELMQEVKKRGGHLITPYNNAQPLAPEKSKTPRPTADRPAWLKPKTATPPAKSTTRTADQSGGML
jgi:hypothetical protein